MTDELFLDVDRTKPPERHEHDEYITERNLIRAAIDFLGPTRGSRILDIGAGDGRWGQITAAKLEAKEVVGVDIRKLDKPLGFTEWHQNRDFLTFETDRPFDMIVSNPPYYCAEEIIRRAWGMLAPGGHMVMLLRMAFQTGVERYNNLWSQLHPHTVAVCSRRPSFYGGGTNRTEFSIFYWGKGWDGYPLGSPRRWNTYLLLHERDDE
jgi:SAM-dependent methyltransferase